MGRKVKTSISLDFDQLIWIRKNIKSKRFSSRTHAIEYAIQRLMDEENKT